MRETWKPKPGDRVVRHPRQEEMSPVRVTVTTRNPPPRVLASPLILIYAFASLISLGTVLLSLPFSHHGDGFTPFMDAFFTATSAVTVTGLVIQDTPTYWTQVGQVFILALMFVGGLGFMTIATFLLVFIGQRATLAQQLLVRESLGVNQLGGLLRLTVGIVLVAVAIQVVGFVALFIRFSFLYVPTEAAWQAVFHAVSGFNNAGFLVLREPGGLVDFRTDKIVLGVITVLVILGAVSYWVMVDVVRFRKFSLFSLNTKLVLILTGAMLFIGTVGFLAFEYNNESTLKPLSIDDKLMVSVFQSVAGRTAGFYAVDHGETEAQTNFFFTGLMFVGGASASTAGGIKLNTLAVILLAMLATFQGKTHAFAFGREIPESQVRRAMAIGAVAILFVFLVALLLTFSESGFGFLGLFFESVSAFGTVGLSTGVTPLLSSWGHLILIFAMFVGRIGPLALALAMAGRAERDMYRYAQERVTIG